MENQNENIVEKRSGILAGLLYAFVWCIGSNLSIYLAGKVIGNIIETVPMMLFLRSVIICTVIGAFIGSIRCTKPKWNALQFIAFNVIALLVIGFIIVFTWYISSKYEFPI